MKKKILSFILVLCLIVPCAVMLSACGKKDNSKSPFNVSGKTLIGTGECSIIWDDGVTAEQKQEFLSEQFGDKTLEEIYATLASSEICEVSTGMTIEYKADGTVKITNSSFGIDIDGYYVQSEDLKTITNYRDADHNNIITDGLGFITYVGNGNYAMTIESSICTFAFIFELV